MSPLLFSSFSIISPPSFFIPQTPSPEHWQGDINASTPSPSPLPSPLHWQGDINTWAHSPYHIPPLSSPEHWQGDIKASAPSPSWQILQNIPELVLEKFLASRVDLSPELPGLPELLGLIPLSDTDLNLKTDKTFSTTIMDTFFYMYKRASIKKILKRRPKIHII